MTDTTIQQEKPRPGTSRIIAGALAGGISSWFLTWCSMQGVDFKTLGVDSEIMKGAITGTLTGFFVAPDTVVLMMRDFLIWVYSSAKILRKAATEGKE